MDVTPKRNVTKRMDVDQKRNVTRKMDVDQKRNVTKRRDVEERRIQKEKNLELPNKAVQQARQMLNAFKMQLVQWFMNNRSSLIFSNRQSSLKTMKGFREIKAQKVANFILLLNMLFGPLVGTSVILNVVPIVQIIIMAKYIIVLNMKKRRLWQWSHMKRCHSVS